METQTTSTFLQVCCKETHHSPTSLSCLDYMFRTSIDKMKDNDFKLTKERSRKYPALQANTPAQAEALLHNLEWAAAGIDHVNAHKTEHIWFNQIRDISSLNASSLKLDKFTYLGSSVLSTKTDINSRLIKAWTAIGHMEVRPDRENEVQFLPSNGRIDTAVWMHYMDAN